jgi:LysM repeat protein
MTGRQYRSSHEPLSSTATPGLTKRRKARHVAAAPVALAAIASMLFGSAAQAVPVSDATELEHLPKIKGLQLLGAGSSSATVLLRADKYTVAAGDTVRSIAVAHGVSTAELLAANGLSWKTLIFAEQQLNIPASSNGTESAHVGESITRHSVVAGETLEAIARRHGVQPRAIMTANGLDRSSRLVVGQRLVIPDASLMSSLPAAQSA